MHLANLGHGPCHKLLYNASVVGFQFLSIVWGKNTSEIDYTANLIQKVMLLSTINVVLSGLIIYIE